MSVKTLMKKQIKAASMEAQKYTCQLFYNLKRIGSGFFIQDGGNYFLLSAAHVLEQRYIKGMMFPNGEQLVSIMELTLMVRYWLELLGFFGQLTVLVHLPMQVI